MSVSVESLGALKRKMTVSVPAEEFKSAFDQKIKKLSQKVKIDGFRPGKVPMNIVKQRYTLSVTHEVAQDLIKSSLYQALAEQKITPVAMPEIEPEEIVLDKPFSYHAIFEVFPEIEIAELDGDKVELISAELQESDIDTMIEQLREKNKNWAPVSRAVKDGDKVVIDFEGFIDDKAFEGGKAEDFSLVIGSNTMITGFEKSIIGFKEKQTDDINVSFPADYNQPELAGKKARFSITVKEIFEGKLPETNDEFAALFNIQSGGMEALRADIKQNMTRELTRRVSAQNRESIFNELLKKNAIEIPESLLDQEIKHLQHEMYHQIFGHEHHENEKIPDFPREIFEEKAKRRVHLGLLFSEYVKKHHLKVDSSRVDAMIEVFATAYERPDEVRAWYRSSKERLAEIEALVMEEIVADKIVSNASLSQKSVTYAEVMNPAKDENKGE